MKSAQPPPDRLAASHFTSSRRRVLAGRRFCSCFPKVRSKRADAGNEACRVRSVSVLLYPFLLRPVSSLYISNARNCHFASLKAYSKSSSETVLLRANESIAASGTSPQTVSYLQSHIVSHDIRSSVRRCLLPEHTLCLALRHLWQSTPQQEWQGLHQSLAFVSGA